VTRPGLRAALALALASACHGTLTFDEPCSATAGCPIAALHCNTSNGACVACIADGDCTVAGLARCDTTLGRCVECVASATCPAGNVCTDHRCVASCAGDSDDVSEVVCPAATPHCDQTTRLCGCASSTDCARSTAGPVCLPGPHVCGARAADADCPSTAARCDGLTGRCVVCIDTADCPSGTACDPSTGQCTRLF